jgi:quercetin dioxygenase-like cupin family protein
MSEIHADRRPSSAPHGPLDLAAAGDSLMVEALGMSSGRAAKSLTPGAHEPLTQTLLALRAGVEIGADRLNGPATIYLLRGTATIDSHDETIELASGQWAAIPMLGSDLRAGEDAVALITVALTAEPFAARNLNQGVGTE